MRSSIDGGELVPGLAAAQAFWLVSDVGAHRVEGVESGEFEDDRRLANEALRQPAEAVADDDAGRVHADATLADIDWHAHEGETPCMFRPPVGDQEAEALQAVSLAVFRIRRHR